MLRITRLRLSRRLDKAQQGNLGDVKPVGEGLFEMSDPAIQKIEDFFHSLDVPTRFSDYDLGEELVEKVLANLEKHGWTAISEHGDVTLDVSRKILNAAL